MLVLPATAPLQAVCHLHLLVSDRPDVPQRVLATACRRQAVVLALVFERGGPDGTAQLELAVEVAPHLRALLVERIAALVDVREVRSPSENRRPGRCGRAVDARRRTGAEAAF